MSRLATSYSTVRNAIPAGWQRLSPDARSFAGGTLWLSGGDVLNRGGRFILLLLLARQVGAESYGAWVIAVATATILANAGDAGLATVVTREIAADRTLTQKYLANLWTVTPLLALLGFGLLLASSPGLVHGTSLLLLLILGLSGTLESAAFLLLSPLRAHGRMQPEGLVRAFLGCALLLLGGALVYAGEGRQEAIAPVFPAVASVSVVIAVIAVLKSFGAVRPAFDLTFLRPLLASALPVFASTVMFFVYFRIDAFLVAYLKGDEATGLYGAAYNFAFGLAFLPLMFGRALLPRFAACETAAALRSLYLRTGAFTAAFAGGLSTLLVLAAPLFLHLYGADFRGAQAPYLLLIVAQAFYFFTHLNYVVLFARARSRTAFGLTVLALSVNLAANFLLIPSLGASGAALAMIISEALLLGLQLGTIRTLIKPTPASPALATALATTGSVEVRGA
ncbi:MAG: oligosaccharide flippase family protein [Candidatus Bathyarchaeota archaeon]|nr:oligosaccharide flippase family protein [Candidatus Bathyarchaeota archaeon]